MRLHEARILFVLGIGLVKAAEAPRRYEVNRIPTHPEVLSNPARLRQGFDFINVDPVKYNDKIDYYSNLWHEWFLQ